jgi:MoxR-like ATPase
MRGDLARQRFAYPSLTNAAAFTPAPPNARIIIIKQVCGVGCGCRNGDSRLMTTLDIEGVSLHLAHPDELPVRWVGQEELMRQLLAAWMVIHDQDLPMNPRLLGKPGVGKTTLAYAAAKRMNRDVYILQATMDTRPEDLLVTPVIEAEKKLRYVASPLVSAMLSGGVAIIDEGNRMSEKSWASLAPLLDNRRYVESIVAGIKIKAHPDFRLVSTMNDDASTFELPEYIHSRLQPQIWIDFPERDEEYQILQENLPFAEERILTYVTDFLQRAHAADERYTVRDGINIGRFAIKLASLATDREHERRALETAVTEIVGEEALRYIQGGSI